QRNENRPAAPAQKLQRRHGHVRRHQRPNAKSSPTRPRTFAHPSHAHLRRFELASRLSPFVQSPKHPIHRSLSPQRPTSRHGTSQAPRQRRSRRNRLFRSIRRKSLYARHARQTPSILQLAIRISRRLLLSPPP